MRNKHRNHNGLIHTRSTAAHSRNKSIEINGARGKHNNRSGENTDKQGNKYVDTRNTRNKNENIRDHLYKVIILKLDLRCIRAERKNKSYDKRGNRRGNNDNKVGFELVTQTNGDSVKLANSSIRSYFSP